MRRFVPSLVLIVVVPLLLVGCHRHRHGHHPHYPDRGVAITVEVYDPVSGFVWEDVAVRVVEAEHEWSGLIVVNPDANDWYYTDHFGVVDLGPYELAAADVGFIEDGSGRARIGPGLGEDEAVVLLEVWAPGLGSVFEQVDISWEEPEVYVRIPF
jgi:hypothetical protein